MGDYVVWSPNDDETEEGGRPAPNPTKIEPAKVVAA
jgi:hypothetical protein